MSQNEPLGLLAFVGLLACLLSAPSHAASLSAASKVIPTTSKEMDDLTPFVDTRVGGGGNGYGIGQLNPGPQIPFGTIRVGPDTSLGIEPARIPFDHFSGYWYQDTWLECFSHARVVGAGEGDLKNFGVMISHRDIVADPSIVSEEVWYRSPFPEDATTNETVTGTPLELAKAITSTSTRKEVAVPAYYSANIPAATTRAELTTCGAFSGMHRYTCVPNRVDHSPTGCNFVLDVCHDASLEFWYTIGKSCKGAEILNTTQGVLPSGATYTNITATMLDGGSFLRSSPTGSIPLFIHMMVVVKAIAEGSAASPSVDMTISGWENRSFVSSPTGKYTTSGSLGLVLSPAPLPPQAAAVEYTVYSGLSFVNAANAQRNLDVELANLQARKALPHTPTFDDCRSSTQEEWNGVLNRVQVKPRVNSTSTIDNDPALRGQYRTFLASVYNAHRVPTRYDESSDGTFIRLNFSVGVATYMPIPTTQGAIRDVPIHRRSDLSIWDEYRTHMPFLTWLAPKVAYDTAFTMLAMADEEGVLPRWPLANVETNCMVGRHSAVIIADFMMKKSPWMVPSTSGVPHSLYNRSIDAMVSAVKSQCRQFIDQYGYVPEDLDNMGASKTLDYALDAGALVNLGTTLNITRLYGDEELNRCAQSYRQVFYGGDSRITNQTSESKWLICPRFINGSFACPNPFLPYFLFQEKYTEGNGAQYRWYVPHDPRGLLSLFPTAQDYVDTLQQFFVIGTEWPFDTALPNWAFWPGNEPSLLTPYLFNYAGPQYAHLTQYWAQRSLNRYFNSTPGGIPGNDDYGTMSAFVFFGYCGLYPVASSANAEYSLTTPFFDEYRLSIDADTDVHFSPWRDQVGGGSADNKSSVFLVIRAHNRPPSGTVAYIKRVVINGQVEAKHPIISHQDLMRPSGSSGPSTLDFYLTDTPSIFGSSDEMLEVYHPPTGPDLVPPSLQHMLDGTLTEARRRASKVSSVHRPPLTRSKP